MWSRSIFYRAIGHGSLLSTVKSLYFLARTVYFFFLRNFPLDCKCVDVRSKYEKTNARVRSPRYMFVCVYICAYVWPPTKARKLWTSCSIEKAWKWSRKKRVCVITKYGEIYFSTDLNRSIGIRVKIYAFKKMYVK